MKKLFLSLLTVLLTTNAGYSQDFRNSSWGDSMEKVKALEKATSVSKEEQLEYALGYTGWVAEFKVFIVYGFVDNKLAKGIYRILKQKPQDPSLTKGSYAMMLFPSLKDDFYT